MYGETFYVLLPFEQGFTAFIPMLWNSMFIGGTGPDSSVGRSSDHSVSPWTCLVHLQWLAESVFTESTLCNLTQWANFLTYKPLHDKNQQMTVCPAKTQISLGIRPVWSESLLSAWRKLRSLTTHLAHSEDSDQTGRMPRLIWVFAGRTVILFVLSCRGSVMQFYSIYTHLCTLLIGFVTTTSCGCGCCWLQGLHNPLFFFFLHNYM